MSPYTAICSLMGRIIPTRTTAFSTIKAKIVTIQSFVNTTTHLFNPSEILASCCRFNFDPVQAHEEDSAISATTGKN